MNYILYILLYILITGLFMAYTLLSAPTYDGKGNKIEESKIEVQNRRNKELLR